MHLTIPDELLEKKQISSQKIKQEFSLFLIEKINLTIEQATQIAGIPLSEFKLLLENNKHASKKISKLSNLKNRNCVIGNSDDLIHYDWSKEWKTPSI